MTHRIWKQTKQQQSLLPGPAVPGCCLFFFHFLWAILSTSTVDHFHRPSKSGFFKFPVYCQLKKLPQKLPKILNGYWISSLPVEAVPLDLEGPAGAGELVAHLAEEALEGRVLGRDQPRAQLVAGVVAAPEMQQKERSRDEFLKPLFIIHNHNILILFLPNILTLITCT